MQIVLFRHGPAGRRDASRWPDDALRPLTARGEQRARAAADGLRRLLTDPVTQIVTSPFARAARTAELLGEAFPDARRLTRDVLAAGAAPRDLMRLLDSFDGDDVVALVGHEPDLGRLAGLLVFGEGHVLPLKKAGACVLNLDAETAPGAAEMVALLPPRALRRMARHKAAV